MRKPAFALLAALLCSAVLPGQEPTPDQHETPAEPKLLSAWPPLSASQRDRALALVGQLKKDDEAVRQAARDELVAMGAAGAPILFQKVGDADKELALNAELYPVFDAVLGHEHALLMAEQAKKKKLELRKYLVRRLCPLADERLHKSLEGFAKDTDAQIAFHAQLGLAALGDRTALIAVLEYTRTHWAEEKDLAELTLPKARSDAAALAVAEHIGKAPPAVQAAGLRLLRHVATENQWPLIKSYLSAVDHGVLKEAVNAMRVQHGMPALENLSAFQSIGMAKEWLTR